MPSRKQTSKKRGPADYQPTLFPGQLNIDIPLRAAISEALRTCGKDRYQVAAELSRMTGVDVSKNTLDNWSAESRAKSSDSIDLNNNKRWGLPAELLPAFCEVTEDRRPLELIAQALSLRICQPRDLVRMERQKIDKQIERLLKRDKELRQDLEGEDIE